MASRAGTRSGGVAKGQIPAAIVAALVLALGRGAAQAASAITGGGLLGGVATQTSASEEASDAILDRLLDDVLEDVPETRAGLSRTAWVVRGRATASWTSYSSVTDSSFGAGVSEFFGAGASVTIQGTSSGEALSRYNALYPGFGSSGSWLMQPRQTKDTSADSKMDAKKLMTQLWASVSLRDNIVTVFGYILNAADNPLSSELYASLYHLYDATRLRRVPAFGLVRAVGALAGGRPGEQLLVLFRALRALVPRHLQSAVSVWVDACRKDPRFLDGLLRPGGGPLVVDLLAGIDASVIGLLSEKLEWNHETSKEHKSAKELFGASVFEDIFIALGEGKLELTQSLFAILLANRPTNDVAAEKDETERYLVDVLRLGNVEPWLEIVEVVSKEDTYDPDKLISKVLKLISENKKIDPLVREDARYLRPYIREPSVTYANKYYNVLSGMISKPSIDILTMLKGITSKEYPHDVVKAKNRLVNYILDGQLNVEFVTKGFNRFDHVTPLNILIALLTRINRRLPNLPKHIIQSVKTLQLFLLYKKFLCTMSATIPTTFMDASVLVTAYDDPSVPSNVTDIINELVTTLPGENVDWDTVAKKMASHTCVRPRQCIYNFLCFIVNKKYIPKGRSTTNIKKLLKHLDGDGNPIVKRPLPIRSVKTVVAQATSMATPTPTKTIIISSPKPRKASSLPPKSIDDAEHPTTSPWHQTSQSADEIYLQEVEGAVKQGLMLPFPALSAVQQEEPASIKYPATCLPPSVNGSKEYIKMLPAHMLLSWDRLPHLLENGFRFEHNIKKGELLINLLEKISELYIIKRFEEVHLYVQSFLQFLYNFKEVSRAESVIHFPALLNALPVVTSDSERQYVTKLKNYFSRPEFYKQLGPDFEPQLHRTRGPMLRYVLIIMDSLPMVKWDPILKRAIEYYKDKVYMDGYGAQEVEWAPLSEVVEPTYLDMTVFRVLNHSNMPQEVLLAERGIFQFIFTELIPNVHLRELKVYKFKTKGEFLKGTFEYLLSQDSVKPQIKNDIRLLIKYIRMDGRGSEPLDYNTNIQ